MSPEQLVEAFARGLMQGLLQNKDVARKPRRSSSAPQPGSHRGTSARATTEVDIPPPIQTSMFEPPNADTPTPYDLDKILNISRPASGDPPGTYRPGEGESVGNIPLG